MENVIQYVSADLIIVNGWNFSRSLYQNFVDSRQWPNHKPGMTGFIAWEFIQSGKFENLYSKAEIEHKTEHGIFLLATLQRYGFYAPDSVFACGYHREKDKVLIPYCRHKEEPPVYLRSNISEKVLYQYYTIEIPVEGILANHKS